MIVLGTEMVVATQPVSWMTPEMIAENQRQYEERGGEGLMYDPNREVTAVLYSTGAGNGLEPVPQVQIFTAEAPGRALLVLGIGALLVFGLWRAFK